MTKLEKYQFVLECIEAFGSISALLVAIWLAAKSRKPSLDIYDTQKKEFEFTTLEITLVNTGAVPILVHTVSWQVFGFDRPIPLFLIEDHQQASLPCELAPGRSKVFFASFEQLGQNQLTIQKESRYSFAKVGFLFLKLMVFTNVGSFSNYAWRHRGAIENELVRTQPIAR